VTKARARWVQRCYQAARTAARLVMGGPPPDEAGYLRGAHAQLHNALAIYITHVVLGVRQSDMAKALRISQPRISDRYRGIEALRDECRWLDGAIDEIVKALPREPAPADQD
jgi:hypothetical protein